MRRLTHQPENCMTVSTSYFITNNNAADSVVGTARNIIKTLFFIGALLLPPSFAFGAAPSASLSIQVVPSRSGGCGVTDSPYVPAGYTCDPSLSDEFNGSSLDTSKWSVSSQGGPSGNLDAANVTVGGGSLRLALTANGSSYNFGGIGSKFSIPGGPVYVEYRAKLCCANASGAESNIQLWGRNPTQVTELDSPETNCPYGNLAYYVWSGSPNWNLLAAQNFGCHIPVSAFDGNFHVFGILMRNGQVTWYFDGSALQSFTPTGAASVVYTDAKQFTTEVCQTNCSGGVGNISNLPDYEYLDYIRTYR
jgi:hypothetical protein